MLHQNHQMMCVALTQPTWGLGKKWSESNKVVFSLLLCGVYRGGREPICCSYLKLQILFVPFVFNGFCFGANGREETQLRHFRVIARVFNLFPIGSLFWNSFKNHCHGFSLLWFHLRNPTLTLALEKSTHSAKAMPSTTEIKCTVYFIIGDFFT